MARPPKTSAAGNEASTAPSRLQMTDIARLAGVAASTVSRALSGSPLVSEETRERITELARSLNYTVNVGAQNLRTRQNQTVSVVVPSDRSTGQHLSDPFFLSLIGSIADALTERGYEMLLSRVDADHLDRAALPFETGRALGVILIGQWHHHDQLNEMALRRVPMVVWGALLSQQLYCTVGSDNRRGGLLATRHLIEQRKRRIVFLGDPSWPEVGLRHEGYEAAHAEAGLQPDPALCLKVPFSVERIRDAIEQLSASKTRFDAIFASSDLTAMTAINALRRMGLDCPGDVAVVGYDDVELAAHFHPTLSTVRQPIATAGVELVDALMRRVAGEKATSRLLPTELVLRESAPAGRLAAKRAAGASRKTGAKAG